MIIINLKNYKFGDELTLLGKKIKRYLGQDGIVCVSSSDFYKFVNLKLNIYAQHVDWHPSGKSTGFVVPESLASYKVKGSLLNHAEHQISFEEIKKTVLRCNEHGLKLIICSSNLKEIKELIKLKPYGIAFEDPYLISTGKSIVNFKQEDLIEFVKILKNKGIKIICGAGVSSAKDYIQAKKIGCDGVLISSAIVNSKNPDKLLKELEEAINEKKEK